MAKRPRVSAALHAELTEYSSLLRALRTSDTLDLASHLIHPPPAFISQASLAGDVSLTDEDDDDDDDEAPDEDEEYIDNDGDDGDDGGDGNGDGDDGNDDDGGDDDEALDESPPADSVLQDAFSDFASPSQSRDDDSNLEHSVNKRKSKRKDTWTRWPLLVGDVHIPEWSLSDEVKNIADRILALASFNQRKVISGADVEEAAPDAETPSGSPDSITEQDDLTVPDVVLRALTADSATFLARALALVTAHVPAAEKSMQNRITPISWETVVDVVCANGVVSPQVAQVVRERMSCLFPPTRPDTIHRTHHLLAMKQRMSQMLSKHEGSILDVPDDVLDMRKVPLKRKRGPSKKKRAGAGGEAGTSASAAKRQRVEDG